MPGGLRRACTAGMMALSIAALFYTGLWGFRIQTQRPLAVSSMGLADAYHGASQAVPLAGTALLAGFRGLAADLLWLKLDHFWHEGQWQRILPMYRLVAALQPRYTLVWSLGGWHMAYNLSERARRNAEFTPAQKDKAAAAWVQKGLDFLREGLRHNPDKPELYFDLGWTYFDKLKNPKEAVGWLEKAMHRKDDAQTLRVLAHAYEDTGRPADALRLWRILLSRGDAAARRQVARLEAAS